MGVTSQLALSPSWHRFLLSQPSQEVTGLDPVLSTRLDGSQGQWFGFTGRALLHAAVVPQGLWLRWSGQERLQEMCYRLEELWQIDVP